MHFYPIIEQKIEMKQALITLLMLITVCGTVQATDFNNETLHYVVSYKWGLIHKDAGDATLSLRRNGSHYNAVFTASSRKWIDRFYVLRDTLLSTMNVEDLSPVSYKKITSENGHRQRDELKYSKARGITKGDVTKYRIKDGKWTAKKSSLTASGPVFDMLSVFYYLRALDYDKLATQNHVYKVTIFSGSQCETLTIRSYGKETIKLRDKSKCEAYKISFKFTQRGGKKSSEDINTWISTDADHIPLYMVGKLPIGEVRAYYTGKS